MDPDLARRIDEAVRETGIRFITDADGSLIFEVEDRGDLSPARLNEALETAIQLLLKSPDDDVRRAAEAATSFQFH